MLLLEHGKCHRGLHHLCVHHAPFRDLHRLSRVLDEHAEAYGGRLARLDEYDERLEFERVLSDTEAGLDSETFARLRGEGQAMSADATVAYALDYLRDGAVSR